MVVIPPLPGGGTTLIPAPWVSVTVLLEMVAPTVCPTIPVAPILFTVLLEMVGFQSVWESPVLPIHMPRVPSLLLWPVYDTELPVYELPWLPTATIPAFAG